MSGINQTMRVVRELVGKDGKQVFEKQEFLNKVKSISEDVAKTIEESVSGVTNPTFEVTGKAAANYNIASFRIKNGNDVIGSGSASISFSDVTKQPELKSRMSLPNGVQSRCKSQQEVFVDVKTDKNGKDLVTEYSVKDGKVLYTNQFDTKVSKREITRINGHDVDNGLVEYNKDGQIVSKRFLYADSDRIECFDYEKRLKDNSLIDMHCTGTSYTKLEHTNRLDKKKFEINGYGDNDPNLKFVISFEDESGYNVIRFNNKNKVCSTFPEFLVADLGLYGKPVEQIVEKYNLGELWKAYQNLPHEVLKAEELLPAMKAKYPNWEKIVPEK